MEIHDKGNGVNMPAGGGVTLGPKNAMLQGAKGTSVSASGTIRSSAGLPANYLSPDEKFITTFDSSTNMHRVKLTLNDSSGKAVPQKSIIAFGYDTQVCTLDAQQMFTGTDGTAVFIVKKVAFGTTIITFRDEFGAETMVSVTVNPN